MFWKYRIDFLHREDLNDKYLEGIVKMLWEYIGDIPIDKIRIKQLSGKVVEEKTSDH